MYTINENLKVDSTGSVSAIPVGINEGVSFEGVTKKQDKNGKSYLSFSFKDSEDNELMHNEFEVNPDYVTPKAGESKEDAINRRVNNMLIRVKHICTQFIAKDKFVVSGTTYDEFCNNLINLMSTANTSAELRLKVVLNYKDYSSLPNFTPFIENVETHPTTSLKINPKYDKMEPDTAKASTEAASTDETVLPF